MQKMKTREELLADLKKKRSDTLRARDDARDGTWRDSLDKEAMLLTNQVVRLEASVNDINYKPEVETR